MRINFTRQGSILRLATLALLAISIIQSPGRIAQACATATAGQSNSNDGEIVILSLSVLGGLGRGQTMRFTLFNPPKSQREPLRVHVKLCDQAGNVIAESAEATVPPGEFRSFDFNRSNIPLAGEPGTGRLQVRGTIFVFEHRHVDGVIDDQFPTAIEVLDTHTGLGQSITYATSAYSPIIIA